jgi:methyl-accepting chemotaxis protein
MFNFFNQRLSIAARLTAVAAIFVVSSVVSAVLLANYGMTNIAFSQKERLGTDYIGLIWQALDAGTTDVPGHARYDETFDSAAQYTAFTKAQGRSERVAAAVALIVAVADGSNLTLDPDLDSYYAMDAATVKLPTLLNSNLALSQAIALPESDSDRRMKIALALDRFETIASAAYGSLDTSMKNNAAGVTRAALQSPKTKLKASTDAMSQTAHSLLNSASGDYAATAAPFDTALSTLQLATNAELARLLDVRIAGLVRGLILNIAIVAAMIALSLALTIAIIFGLSRRFTALGEAMSRLNRGDKTVEVPYLDDTNETGHIAETLARMKESLIQRETDERQREADRLAAAQAQKAAETEAQIKSETLVVETFGAGLKALAEGNLAFRLVAELPPAYRTLQENFNQAVAAFETTRQERETAAKQQLIERQEAHHAQKRAAEEAQSRAVEMVVSSFGEGLKALAARDLTFRIVSDLPEDYRQLQLDFNAALDQLGTAMKDIDRRAAEIASTAQQITGAADEMAQRTERQAASIEQTAAAMEEITATVDKSAQNTHAASNNARNAKSGAEHGNTVTQNTVCAMRAIAQSSGQITQIISVIDEIAFQTNLLALNAGVEAARAGEAGKGFAVVASEVRALAQRSAEAAKQIKSLIKTSEDQVETGVEQVGESGKALQTIVEDINSIHALMTEIDNAQKEQARALGEINSAINQMDQTTQQNSAMAEESHAAAMALADSAAELAELIAQFRTADGIPERRAA